MDVGYLTRRLVKVVQLIIVRRRDCDTIQGKWDICGLQESRSHGNEIKKQQDMPTTTTFRIRNMPARASIKMLVTDKTILLNFSQ
jgi:DNA-directed RNA polymerase beta' subunit